MDDLGNFIKSGSRNKFYSQSNRINMQLPDMIEELTIIIQNTIDELANLYKSETKIKENPTLTQESLDAIANYNKFIIED